MCGAGEDDAVAASNCMTGHRNREKRVGDEEDDESEVVRESIRGIEPLLDMEDFRPSSISEVVFRIFLKASKLEPMNSDALKVRR